MMTGPASERRLGVFLCQCGGNISDYVDMEKLREAVKDEPGLVEAGITIFACSDAAQQEMIDAIQKERLDGIVVASCSPKLHLFTFRAMAERAGMNPYQYVQANIREQCSWAHRRELDKATEKAARIVRAAIAKARLSEPLRPMRVETEPQVLVVGGGMAGLRAALALSDLGITVYVAEREELIGGWTARFGAMFPADRRGTEMVQKLRRSIQERENVTVFTRAEVVEKSGNVGDFSVRLSVRDTESISLNVGAIVVATGFEAYTPRNGEYGFGQEGVLTLPEFKRMLDEGEGPLTWNGKPVRTATYIYCVGSRQGEEVEKPNRFCSRYCCTAACHAALTASRRDKSVCQYHLFRDMRTYGKYETIYEAAAREGSVFLRWDPADPPSVFREDGRMLVRVKDRLLGGEELEIPSDLVVLVTGMVPRENVSLVNVLKLPVGVDGFFNEIHPKLRPVETVVDGVFIAGTAQGPKTLAESVASSLAAVAKTGALLMKGYVDLEPFVAEVDPLRCTWCGKCTEACPYGAIERIAWKGREVARVNPALCKGGGACVPACPEGAIDLLGYSDREIKGMIDALAKEAVHA
jgi:heterodisulfide reductase subunit A